MGYVFRLRVGIENGKDIVNKMQQNELWVNIDKE